MSFNWLSGRWIGNVTAIAALALSGTSMYISVRASDRTAEASSRLEAEKVVVQATHDGRSASVANYSQTAIFDVAAFITEGYQSSAPRPGEGATTVAGEVYVNVGTLLPCSAKLIKARPGDYVALDVASEGLMFRDAEGRDWFRPPDSPASRISDRTFWQARQVIGGRGAVTLADAQTSLSCDR